MNKWMIWGETHLFLVQHPFVMGTCSLRLREIDIGPPKDQRKMRFCEGFLEGAFLVSSIFFHVSQVVYYGNDFRWAVFVQAGYRRIHRSIPPSLFIPRRHWVVVEGISYFVEG